MSDTIAMMYNEQKQNINDIININDIEMSDINNIKDISTEYDKLEKTANEFLNKLKQNKTELRLDLTNDKIKKAIVYHFTPADIDYNRDSNCFNNIDYYEDSIVSIFNRCRFIEEDLKTHKNNLDYLVNNTKEIIEEIGIALFRSDNIWFKEEIIKTQTKLNKLLDDYVWEF
jgi:hypothetical protein